MSPSYHQVILLCESITTWIIGSYGFGLTCLKDILTTQSNYFKVKYEENRKYRHFESNFYELIL